MYLKYKIVLSEIALHQRKWSKVKIISQSRTHEQFHTHFVGKTESVDAES